MKRTRQEKILEIIGGSAVENQEELSRRLLEAGYGATQATVSRDIKELKLIKLPDAGGRYRYSAGASDPKIAAKHLKILGETVIRAAVAGNLVVVSTYSGMASAAAAAIDAAGFGEIVGSIAGDDTIFIALADGGAAAGLAEKIRNILRG